MELKILIGKNNKNEIVLAHFKNKTFKIDPNKGIYEQFKEIDKQYPRLKFLEFFNQNMSTITIRGQELEKYLPFAKSIVQKLENTEKKIEQIPTIKNSKVYQESINKCREDIMTGRQLALKHTEYHLGNTLHATSDIGKKSEGQQDSNLILEHPQNKEFKLIAVSDGVGGSKGGDLVSRHIVVKLTEWFENLNPENYNNMSLVESSLKQMLPNILKDLKAPSEASATLSLVVIGKDNTLIANIGDSKVYSMKNGNLTQETKDNSYVQMLYDDQEIPEEELMRFHVNSNVIMKAIGMDRHDKASFKIIDNASYDRIIAVSDGVADCLSKQEIEILVKTSKKEHVANNLVEAAVTRDSSLNQVVAKMPEENNRKAVKAIRANEKDYYKKIIGGKDNTTAVAYTKK